jgi:hypothetical protein
MRVKIEKVLDLLRQLEEINKYPIDQIEWIYNNESVKVSKKEIEDWKFTGLSNVSFIEIILTGELEKCVTKT